MSRLIPPMRMSVRNAGRSLPFWILFGLLLASVACGRPSTEPASPSALKAQARQVEGLESLIVWHRGTVRLELYSTGDAETMRDVRSITKSVTSLLVGIALDQGRLASVDRPIAEIFDHEPMSEAVRAADIRLRHLLTMSTGIRWGSEDVRLYQAWRGSGDPIGFYLKRSLESPPGQAFSYASAATHLLGAAVETATDTPLAKFAEEHLFTPLGIDAVQWQSLSDGRANAGGALQLRTRDLLKLGLLVLGDGRYQDRQIVSTEWIEQSTGHRIDVSDEVGYGYLWWVGEVAGKSLIMAQGFGGQTLAIVPELGLVVANTSRWRNISDSTAERQGRAIQSFYLQRLLPVILADERTDPRVPRTSR